MKEFAISKKQGPMSRIKGGGRALNMWSKVKGCAVPSVFVDLYFLSPKRLG